ncbi:MAG: LytR C-terminal domain-containing protein [Candidatus Levybacteria bacterium]|nr:LytR C-terminal domain-containing protein [Candidatus Levybacteria bacterium]
MEEQLPSFNPNPRKRSFRKLVSIIVFLLILGGIGYFGATAFFGGNSEEESKIILTPTDAPTPTEEVTPTPEESPTPTPKPTASPIDTATGLDRSELTVEVQNGSGQVGAASRASDFLKSLGYRVIATGNANNFEYENVTISVKSEVSKYLSLLKSDLSSQYTVGSTSATLSASSSADALVIVGK